MRATFIILLLTCTVLGVLFLAGRRKEKSLPEILFASVSGVFIWMSAGALGLTVIGEYSLAHLDLLLAATAVLLGFVLLFTRLAGRTGKKGETERIGQGEGTEQGKWTAEEKGTGQGKGAAEEISSVRVRKERKRPDRYHLGLFLLCLAALALYLSYPTEYIIGGRDPGVYAIQGAYINDNGGLYIHDDYISGNYDRLRDVIRVGYPGFYSGLEFGVSPDPGRIVPQFLPMFPSLLAVGYSLAGVAGAVRVNAFVAILALLAFYVFAKGMIGRKGAFLATVLLAFNPSQIWNARITQTELLSQFLFFAALAAFTEGYRRNDGKRSAVCGLLMGISCFNRIDSYIFGLGIYICTAYLLLVDRKKSRLFLSASAGYTVCMVLSVLYGYRFSYPYYRHLWADGSLKALLVMNGVFFLLIPLAYLIRRGIIDRKPDRFRPLFAGFMRLKRRRLPQWGVFVLFALFLVGTFIRPVFFNGGAVRGTEEYFRAHSLVEFGFYVPQIAMLFALLGLYHIIRDKGFHPNLIFLSIALASILIYSYRPSITPDHPWASRRWITVNIPAILLMAVYGIQRLKLSEKRLNRWIKSAVTGMILVSFLAQSGLFLFQAMLTGYGEQFAEVAETIPEDGVAFAEDVQLASPLTYINGKKVYLLKEEGFSEPMAKFIEEEGSVYGIGWPSCKQVDFMFQNGISLSHVSSYQITGLYPEESRGRYPEKLVRKDYDAGVRRLDYSPENLYYTYSLTTDFLTQNGVPQGEAMVSDGQAGFLLFANYTALSAGTYELSFSGSLPEEAWDWTEVPKKEDPPDDAAGEDGVVLPGAGNSADTDTGFLDVVYDRGGRQLALRNLQDFLQGGRLEDTVTFTLPENASDLEFRFYAGKGVNLKVDGMTLRKVK